MKARQACATALLIWAGGVFAAPPDDLNSRVTRLERIMESQALVDMLSRIESLQQEVQELRGKVDEQSHTLVELQRRNRELYTQLDRRLTSLEQAGGDTPDETPFDGAGDGSGPVDEQTVYQRAFELLRGLHYEQATSAFNKYLEQYPKGRYAPMAQYWIGEASYVQREFKAAIPAYQKLIDDYPTSPKVPEAMFKIGASYQELGDEEAAAKAFTALSGKFPDSPEAAQARAQLQQGKSAQ
jgi:tol-pal system protein YbgF